MLHLDNHKEYVDDDSIFTAGSQNSVCTIMIFLCSAFIGKILSGDGRLVKGCKDFDKRIGFFFDNWWNESCVSETGGK